jgi:cullin 1
MGLNTLNAYENDFEQNLLLETSLFYKRESTKWISEDSCPSFMKKAEERLFQETNRAQSYLHVTSEQKLIQKCEIELISIHQNKLMESENSGLLSLLEDYKTEDLSRMYRLFKRVSNIDSMAKMTKDFIIDEGNKVVSLHEEKEELDGNAFIQDLLKLHDKYSSLVNLQFDKDPLFLESLKDAFTVFVNKEVEDKKKKTKITTAEMLSNYCDNMMKTTEKIGEENLDGELEKVVYIFGYLSDKDMFQEFYRRQLSKRLLVSKSNRDAERNIISKLKMRQGASYTSKLEGMIKDKTLSGEYENQFSEFIKKKNVKLSMEFTPQVLTTGFWPAFKIDQINLSDEFQNCIKSFKDFYDGRTQSRLLKWVHSLGTCNILARYTDGDKDMSMSTYQACILILFNTNEKLSANEIQKTLGLSFDEIRRNLLSLNVSKGLKILNKTGDTKTVKGEDEFTVNTEFKSKSRKVKIPNLILKVSEKERDDIEKTTMEDRKHAIEAAVVRIMKARREMTHQKLMLETIKQLMPHFKPDPKFIKKRVEDLIQREYLERDENQPGTYKYVA